MSIRTVIIQIHNFRIIITSTVILASNSSPYVARLPIIGDCTALIISKVFSPNLIKSRVTGLTVAMSVLCNVPQLSTSLQEETSRITTANYPTSELKMVLLISSNKSKTMALAFMVLWYHRPENEYGSAKMLPLVVVSSNVNNPVIPL